MASRSFEDSSGTLWEVFEVRRSSGAVRGVSTGLEKGWLAFVSAGGKRRLAPFPLEWALAPTSELERLCLAARVANPPRLAEGRPRIRPAGAGNRDHPKAETNSTQTIPDVAEHSLVRDVVRMFAQEARREKTPAIEAMVRLKAVLAERYAGPDVDASTRADISDVRRVRRWFVEAYYFERPA